MLKAQVLSCTASNSAPSSPPEELNTTLYRACETHKQRGFFDVLFPYIFSYLQDMNILQYVGTALVSAPEGTSFPPCTK